MALTPLCSTVLAWLLCVCGASGQEQRPSERLDFAGEWRIVESLSDAVPLLPGEGMALARASGTVRTGPKATRAVRGPDLDVAARVRTVLRGALQAATRLTIQQSGRTLVVTDAVGRDTSIVADGREVRLEKDGVPFTLKARWKSPLLVVERRFEDGTTISDSYATFTDPRQLVATSTIHNSRMDERPVTLTRVYESVAR
jgi:hypothetical protein